MIKSILAILTKTLEFHTLDLWTSRAPFAVKPSLFNESLFQNCPIGYQCDLDLESFKASIKQIEPTLLFEEILKIICRRARIDHLIR